MLSAKVTCNQLDVPSQPTFGVLDRKGHLERALPRHIELCSLREHIVRVYTMHYSVQKKLLGRISVQRNRRAERVWASTARLERATVRARRRLVVCCRVLGGTRAYNVLQEVEPN